MRTLTITTGPAAGKELEFKSADTFLFGKAADAHVPILGDNMVSRNHFTLSISADGCCLRDHSSNGTFLSIAGEPEIPLRREEFMLRGQGHISFGHAYAKDPSETVEFFCGG